MLHTSRNIDRIARAQFDRLLAPQLIIPATAHAHERLPAPFVRLVHMPIVAAPRLESYVDYGCAPAATGAR